MLQALEAIMSEDPKEIEFYSASLNAWFNTRFEHDKSLLTLSAGGVGLLITLVSTIGVKSLESLILYILALAFFIICLGSLLWIFRRNAKHLEDVVNNTAINDPLLNILDRTAVGSFMLGVLFSSIIGISTAIHSYKEKEYSMTDKKPLSNKVFVNDSVSGVNIMRPSGTEKLSVEGITNMRPSSPQPAQPSKSEESKK